MRLAERLLPGLVPEFEVLVDSWRTCRSEERTRAVRDNLLATRKLSIMDGWGEKVDRVGTGRKG